MATGYFYASDCEWVPAGHGTVIVRGPCTVCGLAHSTPPVSVGQLDRLCGGTVCVQDAFPDLDRPEREFLLTGITPECWDEAVTADEDA